MICFRAKQAKTAPLSVKHASVSVTTAVQECTTVLHKIGLKNRRKVISKRPTFWPTDVSDQQMPHRGYYVEWSRLLDVSAKFAVCALILSQTVVFANTLDSARICLVKTDMVVNCSDKRSKTHKRLKTTLFNQTKQDRMCTFSRDSPSSKPQTIFILYKKLF